MVISSTQDDLEYLALQLEKLRAETEKLRAERMKLESEAEAVPQQANGSYWSEVIKIVGAIVLGIGGVVTAGGSFFVAKNQVELAEFKAAQANEKFKLAESAEKTASAASAAAARLRETAQKEQIEAEKSVRELRETLSNLTAKVQASKPDWITQHLVYIQFRGDLSRDLINKLRNFLDTAGFNAPGAERIAGHYQSIIKYFNAADLPAAEALRKRTETFFTTKGCPIQIRVVPAQAASKITPTIEAWLFHSCKR